MNAETNYASDGFTPADLAHQYGGEFYCDYCETEGHTFGTCPARDDDFGDDVWE